MSTVDETPATDSSGPRGRSRMPGWIRWLHTYVSMLGLGALLFFSVTGLTLNHPDWTWGGRRRESTVRGHVEPGWLKLGADGKSSDPLRVVEVLRKQEGIPGLVDDLRDEDAILTLAFKGPGSSADVTLQRVSGDYEATIIREGPLALLNDLHKGRHTGAVWALGIDLVAGLLTLVAISGLWLLVYVKRRRRSGLWIGVLGAILIGLGCLLWVR